MTVSAACKRGRLDKCLVRYPSGRVKGISDLELADKEWAANGDYTDSPQLAPQPAPVPAPAPDPAASCAPEVPEALDGSDGSLASAAARQKHWLAKLAELKYREASRELVLATDVEREWASILSLVRTKLLGIPTRVRQAIPTLTVADVLLVENLVREALEDLAGAE